MLRLAPTLKHMPPPSTHTHTHLHVCAVQKCVKVGQSDWCLVFEAREKPLLNGSELLCMTTQPFLTVSNVHTKLQEGVGGGREEGRNKKSNGPCDLTVQQSDVNQEGTPVEYLKCEMEGGLP